MPNENPSQPIDALREPSALKEDADTLSFLKKLTDAVFGLTAPEQIIAVAEQMLGSWLKASRVFVAEASADG